MSQACSLLYTISHSNAHAIANAVVQQPSIPVQQAIDLTDLQFRLDLYTNDDIQRNHGHNVSLAARAIANSTSLRLLSYCYDEAFRLAEGELFLASSDAVRYNPTSSILARRCFLKSPVATAGFDAHIAGGIDYFRLRQCMFTNTQESVRALVMAATYFIPRTRRMDSKCTIHPLDALLPHEIARFFSAWYWFKLYVLSYHSRGDGLRQTLAAELKSMNYVQVIVYLGVINFLFNGLEEEQARKFGIMELIVDLTYETHVAADWYDAHKEWKDLRDNIIARYRELETLIVDMEPMLEGCCDVCDEEGNCKPRGENKGIWEL